MLFFKFFVTNDPKPRSASMVVFRILLRCKRCPSPSVQNQGLEKKPVLPGGVSHHSLRFHDNTQSKRDGIWSIKSQRRNESLIKSTVFTQQQSTHFNNNRNLSQPKRFWIIHIIFPNPTQKTSPSALHQSSNTQQPRWTNLWTHSTNIASRIASTATYLSGTNCICSFINIWKGWIFIYFRKTKTNIVDNSTFYTSW